MVMFEACQLADQLYTPGTIACVVNSLRDDEPDVETAGK